MRREDVPWKPCDYVAIGPNCRVVGWGATEGLARSKAIAAGHAGAIITRSCHVRIDNLTLADLPKDTEEPSEPKLSWSRLMGGV